MNDNDLYELSLPAREAGTPAELDLDGLPKPNRSVRALLNRLEQEGFIGDVTVKYEVGQAFYVTIKDYVIVPLFGVCPAEVGKAGV